MDPSFARVLAARPFSMARLEEGGRGAGGSGTISTRLLGWHRLARASAVECTHYFIGNGDLTELPA
jgi:hypothetical protein